MFSLKVVSLQCLLLVGIVTICGATTSFHDKLITLAQKFEKKADKELSDAKLKLKNQITSVFTSYNNMYSDVSYRKIIDPIQDSLTAVSKTILESLENIAKELSRLISDETVRDFENLKQTSQNVDTLISPTDEE